MRGHYAVTALPLAGIVALGIVVWPALQDPSAGGHSEQVRASVALARDLKEMRSMADEHLARSGALAAEFRRSRAAAPRLAASPFVLPAPPEPPEAATPIPPDELPTAPVNEALANEAPAPLPSPPVALPPMRLNGLLFAGAQSLAVIDGEVYRPGESVRGFRIAEVRSDRVVFVHAETGAQHSLLLQGWLGGARESAGPGSKEVTP